MKPRKKFEVERENHDRWLVSYADFITLLFAFFVVMYAMSSVNQGKYKVLTDSLGTAFKAGDARVLRQGNDKEPIQFGTIDRNALQQGSSFIRPFPSLKRQNAQLKQEQEKIEVMTTNITKALEPLVGDGKVHIVQNNRGLRIDIDSNAIFATGSAEINAESIAPLQDVALTLLSSAYPVQIEGHTDSTPIHNAQFYSNWELSAVRASSVVRLFVQAGLEEQRLSATGYGSSHPLSQGDSEEDKAKNRRVSIMVLYGTSETGAGFTRLPK